jgi:hypothetical protein
MISLWYQNIDFLETAGHHGEAVVSYQLPVHGTPGQVASEKQLQKNTG